ncbi:MAG: sulfur carrier protein ThiS [Candidatus Schekmanbacteria bacterium]|nr:MAG: sulfur carrier protein ThiS [Candidatus Schekmanbacteria bacterium]
MKIKVNGKEKELEEEITIKKLIDLLGLADRPLAVELNKEVVKKENHNSVRLKDGDTVEIIHFVGGG